MTAEDRALVDAYYGAADPVFDECTGARLGVKETTERVLVAGLRAVLAEFGATS